MKLFKSSCLKLDDRLLVHPAWFNKWFPLALAYSDVIFSHEPSSLFHHSILNDLSVSMLTELCEPNIIRFLYLGSHLNLG